MSRTSSGDLGLDILLGGGLHLVERIEGVRASATVLIRGGAGAGKTLLGFDLAFALAEALKGDVLIACVELLPTEYAAQIQSARPDVAKRVLTALSGAHTEDAHAFVGLLGDLESESPDLVASIESLAGALERKENRPLVLVIDSLIEGYGIGKTFSRANVDAVMKLAVQRGWALIMAEETTTSADSPWAFAADTVLTLGVESRERGRWIEVQKHRFGASVSGRHELEIGHGRQSRAFPEPHAWRGGLPSSALNPPLHTAPASVPELTFSPAPTTKQQGPIRASFVAVTGSDPAATTRIALTLVPVANQGRDLVFRLDALVDELLFKASTGSDVRWLPSSHGPARSLRTMHECLRALERPPRRVIVGDLGRIAFDEDAAKWIDAITTFASLVLQASSGVPVVAFASGPRELARLLLASNTDVELEVDGAVTMIHRTLLQRRTLNWNKTLSEIDVRSDAYDEFSR